MSPPTLLERIVESLRVDGASWRRLAALGSARAPEWFKRGSPPLIAALLFALVGDRRRAAIDNFEQVLGDRAAARRAALRMFSEFAFCTSEAMEHYSSRPAPLRIDRAQPDVVQRALQDGRGAVVVTGHLGSWDIGAKALRDLGTTVNVVMAREVNATSQAFVRSSHEQVGVRVVFSDASVFSSLGLVTALRRNEVVAIQLDRIAGAGGLRMLPFLGAPAPFPSGPFVLARLAGSPVVPVFVPRVGRRHYEIRFGERIDVPREARDPEVLDRVMGAAVRQLEDAVRRDPTQWFQFAPFWVEPAVQRQLGRPRDRRRALPRRDRGEANAAQAVVIGEDQPPRAGMETSPITINAINEATPYPSSILVSGMAGSVTKLRVTLTGLSHSFPADIGVLLVGPAGQNLVLMNDVGGSIDITGVNMVFDDDALEDVLIGVKIESGSFKPTDVNPGEDFQAPAPQLSGATTLATFNGTNPNGIWSLYIHDDSGGDAGSLAGGWSVTFVPEPGSVSAYLTALSAFAVLRAGRRAREASRSR